jgi:hypothetical protein
MSSCARLAATDSSLTILSEYPAKDHVERMACVDGESKKTGEFPSASDNLRDKLRGRELNLQVQAAQWVTLQ